MTLDFKTILFLSTWIILMIGGFLIQARSHKTAQAKLKIFLIISLTGSLLLLGLGIISAFPMPIIVFMSLAMVMINFLSLQEINSPGTK